MGGLGCSALPFLGFTALVETRFIFCLSNLTFSCFYSVHLKDFWVPFCVNFGIHKSLKEGTWEHIRNADLLYNMAVPNLITQKIRCNYTQKCSVST